MNFFVATLGWALAAGLLGALVALALNRWVPHWSLTKRILLAATASISPSSGFFAFAVVRLSTWFSPDQFLFSFARHVFLILAVSTPIAWLVSRRGRQPLPMDVPD